MLSFGLLLNGTSCIVFVKKDNGKHLGWYKNPKNPHNPSSPNKPSNVSPGKSKTKNAPPEKKNKK